MSLSKWLLVVILVCGLAASTIVSGSAMPREQASSSFTYPYFGWLADANGQAAPDGVYAFSFAIWDAATDGAMLWSETQTNVNVHQGTFAVWLGQVTPLPPLVTHDQHWLAVAVRGPQDAEARPLTPRQLLTALTDVKPAEAANAANALNCAHTHLGESWNWGTSTAVGLSISGSVPWSNGLLKVNNQNNGPTIWGVNNGGGNALRGDGYGTSLGVYGSGVDGVGIVGRSSGNDGITGASTAASKSGVWGNHESDGFGVTGSSEQRFGMLAKGNDASPFDKFGDLLLAGDGEIFADQHLNLFSQEDVYVDLDDNNDDANAILRIFSGTDTVVAQIGENGTKSAVLQMPTYGQRAVYTIESPEVWLEDFGTAALVQGVATVIIDPMFTEMANLATTYHVFVTPLGDCGGLYVTAKTPTSFEVRELGGGSANVSFDYRIVAKRLGLEGLRAEVVTAEAKGK